MTERCSRRPHGAAAAPVLALAALPTPASASGPILVYAAASMTNAVEEIVDSCGRGQADAIKTSFAASSVLAKQIDNGAAAAVFLSANAAWMDYLERRGLLAEASRRRFAANALVIVAPSPAPPLSGTDPAAVIATLPADAHLAMGDPDHVPAGIYARAALQHFGIWNKVRNRTARTCVRRDGGDRDVVNRRDPRSGRDDWPDGARFAGGATPRAAPSRATGDDGAGRRRRSPRRSVRPRRSRGGHRPSGASGARLAFLRLAGTTPAVVTLGQNRSLPRCRAAPEPGVRSP
jgi:hypothetical protein